MTSTVSIDDKEGASPSLLNVPETIVVGFDGDDDPLNPKNWSRRRRWYLTALSGLLGFNAAFASSAPSGISKNLMEAFQMSQELATLTISLFVFGYCVGPLFWGPLSEQYGRRPVFLISLPIYMCFQVGCALAPNEASIMVFRLLTGMFAAAPMSNSGASIADIWDAKTRGIALSIFILAPFISPACGTIVSGYISQSGLSWRWLFWIMIIMAAVCVTLVVFTLPETYAPVILVKKARQLRVKTGDPRYIAPLEQAPPMTLLQRFNHTVTLPFRILFREPTLIATTVYMSFLYGCMYLMFEAFPVVYSEGHHFKPGPSGLVWIPVCIGTIISTFAYLWIFHPRYEAAVERAKPGLVAPEIRLEAAIWGAPLLAIAYFWFGWTSFPWISYWVPLMGGLFFGFAAIWIFLALFNYIVDCYLVVAASALAANTVVRSISAAGFPLFASQMYEHLNPRWASTIMGCTAVAMMPIPILLQRYGPTLRRKSRFVPAVNRT